MIIFAEYERTLEGPAKEGDSKFGYLDASARPEVAECRAIAEEWVRRYPGRRLQHWLGNFRSKDDGQHSSALFELFLIQFFEANGWKVLEVEPTIEGLSGNPDLLIEGPDGQNVVVEAIVPSEKSDAERGRAKLVGDIKDAINAVKISDYYLMLERIEAPSRAINKTRLVDALNSWLENRPDENALFEYEDSDALVKIRVFHRPGRDVDSSHYRSIAVEMGGVSVSTPGDHVKKGLLRKAEKYRGVGLPYLIALNARGFHDTEDDYLAATYGTLAAQFRIGEEGLDGEPEWVRNQDGLFNEGGRPRKKHVSAVILFNGVTLWNWRDRKSCIIHNAFSDRPLGELNFGGDAYIVRDDSLEKVEGRPVGALF